MLSQQHTLKTKAGLFYLLFIKVRDINLPAGINNLGEKKVIVLQGSAALVTDALIENRKE